MEASDVLPETSAPIEEQENTVETAASEGQEPAEASPVAAEETPGASPEQPAAEEASITPTAEETPGYLGAAPGDPGFDSSPAVPSDHSSGIHTDAVAQGYHGTRAGEQVDVVIKGRHFVLPASTVVVDPAPATEGVSEQ